PAVRDDVLLGCRWHRRPEVRRFRLAARPDEREVVGCQPLLCRRRTGQQDSAVRERSGERPRGLAVGYQVTGHAIEGPDEYLAAGRDEGDDPVAFHPRQARPDDLAAGEPDADDTAAVQAEELVSGPDIEDRVADVA